MLVTVADEIRELDDVEDPFGEVVRSRGHELRYLDCTSEADVVERCADADVLVVSKAPVTPKVAEALSASMVVRIGTGYDNVNVRAATDHGIMVSNTPGYSKHQVATHAITLMLAAAREVVLSDRALRQSEGWGHRSRNRQLSGGTIGVVGLGRIGRAVVPKARGFDMDVIAFDPYVPDDLFSALDVEEVGFEELLERADAVTVHAPLTAETHHLFSDDEFARMKDDAVFVNVSRGPIVDEHALARAVEARELWGAGLDVFEREPPEETPVFDHDRIVCSPHRAGRTEQSHARKLEIARGVLADALDGNHPEYLVNPEVLQYADEQLNPEYDRWR